MANLLASLTLAGVLERAHGALRVHPRFLAHAEGTAGRLHTLGAPADAPDVLTAALQTWDEYRQDPRHGARFLHGVLADRDQLGSLRPVFPALDAFSAAA